MTKVIVSGANGFVGGALTRELIANGIKVVALDMEGHNNNLPESDLVEFYPFSLDNAEELQEILIRFIILHGLDRQDRPERIRRFS